MTEKKSLRRDDSGAIMVMGVFMAVLLVGFMYYLIGVGETIFYRERMQDAADSGAWAAAVAHARGMNAIVMINMIMAALVAVLIILKTILFLLHLAQIIGTILAAIPWTNPIGDAILAFVEPAIPVVEEITNTVEEIVKTVVPILNKAETAIAYAVPWIAEAKVIKVSQEFKPPVDLGLFIPNALPPMLPVEDDTCESLVDHAKGFVHDIVVGVINIPVLSYIIGQLVNAAMDAALMFEGSICNGGSSDASDLGKSLGGSICAQQREEHHCDTDSPDDGCDSIDCSDATDSASTGSESSSGIDGDGMAPKKVKDGCNLGAECMQVRAIMVGTPNFDRTMQGVQAGNFGQSDGGGGGLYSVLQTLAKGSVAQAEFYWEAKDNGDGQQMRDDWMWEMNWRARLRRFHIPMDSIFGSACSDGGGFCGALMGGADMINSVIVH